MTRVPFCYMAQSLKSLVLMCSWGKIDAHISMCMVQDLFLAFSNNLRLRVRGVGLVVTQGRVGRFFISFYLVEANTVVWPS